MKLYSIIIPFYNSSATIGKLLDSIPDRDDMEVIIVDDCSSIEEYRLLLCNVEHRKNTEVLRTPINKGAGAARNIALKVAHGRWLLFADADDYFTSSFSEVIHKYCDSACDVVFFNSTSIKLPSGEPSLRHARIDRLVSGQLESELRFAFHGPVCKMIKAELVKQNNILFFESCAFNDALFSAKVGYYAQSIKIDNMPIYCITETSNSVTYTISESILLARIDATVAVNEFFHSVGIKGYDMPVFPHLIYSRKLGFAGFCKVLCSIIKKRINPFKGINQL